MTRRMHPYALYKSRVGLSRSPMQKKAAKPKPHPDLDDEDEDDEDDQ